MMRYNNVVENIKKNYNIKIDEGQKEDFVLLLNALSKSLRTTGLDERV